MPEVWTTSDRRLGFWSAISVPSLGVAYLVCGAFGIVYGDESSRHTLLPAEPFVTICRALMLALIPVLVVVFVVVHAYAPLNRKTFSRAALAFATIFASISSVDNILLLSVARQTDPESVLGRLLEFRWPSVIMALELFAWGPILGLALLFAAPAFRGVGLPAAVRRGMKVGGLLCLGNLLCFVTGDVRYSVTAIIGYDFVVPVVCALLAVLFARSNAQTP